MGDVQPPNELTRNLIVSSTPPGGYTAQEQTVAPERQPPATLPKNPDPYTGIPSHPLAGDMGMAAPLVQQSQGYRLNQPQYVQVPPLLSQRSHSTPHHQPTQFMHNGAHVPQSLHPHPQMSQQGTHIPPTNQRWQTGHSPAGIAYQLSQQTQQYQRGPASPTPNGQYFVPGYQHTFIDSYGQQYTQVLTQHRDPQAQVQSGSCAVCYSSSYPPHHPQSTGPTQTQFQHWYGPQMSPYYPVPPQYIVHQVPVQHLPQPPYSQAPPGPYVRRHSFPLRQLPPKPRESDSGTARTSRFAGHPGMSGCDGRAAKAAAVGSGIGASGREEAAVGGYAEPSARGPGQSYCPYPTLPLLQPALSQSNSSAETSGISTNATTPGALDSSLSSSLSLPHPSLPRGPPRKPKQSGHALWVGNLPTGAQVLDLKEYFSKDAKSDIESVFLISKSNCAFVNYRTEEACSEAMARFHDSRRNSAPSAAGGAMALALSLDPSAQSIQDAQDVQDSGDEKEEDGADGVKSPPVGPKVTTRIVGKDRIFIVKSLTVEDLDLSVRNRIWATQSHNESTLNQAFETADNVYLIFSANKSGEYYGYARMTSPILDDPTGLEWTPSSQPHEDSDLPRAIYTPATSQAPQGRIIDDSARGTIFWEAISDEEVPGPIVTTNEGEDSREKGSVAVAKAWGKPFRVEWVSTTRVPFYRTRGLRNSWNANREVKIARDGTELEENVGRRLIQLFHRNGSGPVTGNQNTHMPTLRAI
ncbi:unnamed protein product [Tuber melanosporum]|uniref:(Perigord truffle) hypothetical protein n=1 Tax=Tuber melanosporum (strain Mel28) TaxID=656061 RepID=D5GNV8_TUBMM|nr:uncharacterized protein GSTUM_00011532001 [Tuber melanosporum]CAZ86201.1 unnamed protein product [Tuber melanosporum]